VTPAYSLMPKDRLQTMTGVSGQMRFVYLIRDPLARLWSHVRMIASRVKDPTGFAAEAVACLNRILSGDLSGEGAGIVARGDYARIIPKLKRAFGARDLWIQCQEEMMTVPGLQRLSAFLGLTPKLDGLDKRVHEGQALALPEDLANRARAWLRPQYEFAATAFPVLPEAWRRNIEKGFA
jgi:hypothetical protein